MTATPDQPARHAAATDEEWMAGLDDSAARPAPAITEHRERHWLRLVAGVIAIALAGAAFAWPEATVHVIAVLFGLSLVVNGFVRAGILLFLDTYPLLYRVLGIIFGVLTGFIGILCLRNLTKSVALLLIIVSLGWLLDGLAQILMAVGGPADDRGGWRIATGLIMVLGAIALLVWPKLGLGTFIFIGATVLAFAGIAAVISAIAGMRTQRA